MKKILMIFILSLIAWVSVTGFAFAETEPPKSSLPVPVVLPVAQKVDYALPYPGILPGHILYPFKMLRDRIMDFFIRDPLKKADFLILMADKRLGAGKSLIDLGKTEKGVETLSKAEAYLGRAFDSAKLIKQKTTETEGLARKLEDSSRKHLEVLEEIRQKVSDTDKQKITDIIKPTQKLLEGIGELKGGK